MRWLAPFLLVACSTSVPVEYPTSMPVPLFVPAWTSAAAEWHPARQVCVDDGASDAIVARAATLAARLVLPVVSTKAHCDWHIHVEPSLPPLADDVQAAWNAVAAEDRHVVVTAEVHGHLVTSLYGATPRAIRFALDTAFAETTLRAPPLDGRLVPVQTFVDAPSLPVRGVVEGFYGLPFSAASRVGLIEEMAEARENTYLYAPQNDYDAHADWASFYDDATLAGLASAVDTATKLGIDFTWAVRPGQGLFYATRNPISFDSDADFERLKEKLTQLRGIGVHGFGLFFDDNAASFTSSEDADAFASVVIAQAYLVNRIDDWLTSTDPDATLWFVGTTYSKLDPDWQDYVAALSAQLHPNIRILWTGNETYSATITADDLAPVAAALGRAPFVWDNWPRNEAALSGRGPDLFRGAAGLLSNPVICSWQHLPASAFYDVLGTAGMYTWRNETYEPRTALARWHAHDMSVAELP